MSHTVCVSNTVAWNRFVDSLKDDEYWNGNTPLIDFITLRLRKKYAAILILNPATVEFPNEETYMQYLLEWT